jgi:DNA-directed RNA polymerase, mitochondrial
MIERQIEIERDMLTDAYQRRDRDNTKTMKRMVWSESKLGIRYTRDLSAAFAKVVKDKLDTFDPNKPRQFNRGLMLLAESKLPAEVIAHLFVKQLLNVIPLVKRKRLKRITLCMKAAELIHDELAVRFFASEKPRRNLLKKLFKQFDKRTYPRHWRKRTIRNYFNAEQIDWNQWTQREKLMVGYALLVWFRDGTGLVSAPRNSHFVEVAPGLLEHATRSMDKRVLDYLIYKPMVTPPTPWSEANLFRGGYLSKNVRSYPLVKGTGSKDVADMQSRDWSRIIPALNALQETRWCINKKVLGVLRWSMYDRDGGIAGLPARDDKPLPPAPEGYGEDEAVTNAHNKLCFLIHSDNREMISKRMSVLTTIAVATKFKEFDAIYFPHNLDSRGRAYPLPVFLQPQGPDYVKALLEFADGLPIENEEQACWLAISGANAYGNDKVSLQERVDWVRDNEDIIFSIANDPTKDVRWAEASEPFQFLRFCYEWKDFTDQGYGFTSHMVTYVDATCSGLQHYSALLRDEVGGRSVNLIPGLERQDIYQDVADRVIEMLMEGCDVDPRIASNLIAFGIDRKMTKRQVMVVPYAGQFASCMTYTRAAVAERIKAGYICPWDRDNGDADIAHTVALAKCIWNAIDEIVVKGKQAMHWLTKAAQAHTKLHNKMKSELRDKAMTWVTPDGFVVRHCRADTKKARVVTFLDGRVDLTLREPSEKKLSSKDMALAVAPNFVHSLDANLLRASILRGLGIGVTQYGMVHDSFGVHAAHMASFLQTCVKPAFIDMYRRDVLKEFADRLPPGLDVGQPPARGTLDLEGVQDSEFFFS